MSIINYLLSTLFSQVHLLFDVTSQINVYNMAAAFFIAFYAFAAQRTSPEHASLEEIGRFIFPRETYLHPSAKFDYFYFFASRLVKIPVFFAAGAASFAANDLTFRILTAAFGPAHPVIQKGITIQILLTVFVAVIVDLVYWLCHWLMHRYTWLWEFHKAHHSAEALTPLTVVRQHPLEEMFFPFAILTTLGIVLGISSYIFGAHTRQIELWGSNIVVLFFNTFISNLRHAHIWLPATGWLGRIIHSPAHHQLHHSNAPKHYGKNLGFYFSLWDWAFGTLCVPEKNETVIFGIGEESAEFHRLTPFMVLPFKNAAHILRQKKAKA